MTQIDEIKAMIRGMMAQEMENFKDAVRHGEAEITSSSVVYTMMQVILEKIERMPSVWHDVTETPRFIDGDTTRNSVAIIGPTPVGVGMSIGTMIDENTIYSPLTRKEYAWGECPFTKWAYITDLIQERFLQEYDKQQKK